MTLSPKRWIDRLSLRLLCALLVVELAFPAHSFALRAPQIKDDSTALSGLEESLGGSPEAPDPESLALRWKEFLRNAEGTFQEFHGTWWSTVIGGYLVEKPPRTATVRLEGALPKGVLGGVHVPLIRLLEELGELTPKIAEERYGELEPILTVRIHTVEEIQAEVSRALAGTRGRKEPTQLLQLSAGGTPGQYRFHLEELRKTLVAWRERFQKLSAGLEESEDGEIKNLDEEAFRELEALLRNPGVPRRVQVTVEEVTRGGARVVYRGQAGGSVRGFLPVGALFLDDEHFVSIEAKLVWLKTRARRSEPLELFPEGIGYSRRDQAPVMIFRLDRLVGPDLFEEERVFQDQIIASQEAGRIRLFLSWLAEGGSDPTERLIQMYYLGAWNLLRPGQAAEVIEWLSKHVQLEKKVQPGQGRALFLLFHDLVRSSHTTNRGRIEWFKTQEEALRGVAAAGPFAGPKAEVLEAIQGLWTLVDKGWAAETKPRALGHIQYAGRRLGTNKALAWLKEVSAQLGADLAAGYGAGLEEVTWYESVEAFLENYRDDLRARGTLARVEIILRERKVPTEVRVIPAQAVVPQTIHVYVMAEDPREQKEWEVALQERLNREQDRLPEVVFLAEPFPEDGRIKTDLPVVVFRQTGAVLPVAERSMRLPVVTLSIVTEVEQLRPSWVYALAVNRALDGARMGPLLDVFEVEDGFAFFV